MTSSISSFELSPAERVVRSRIPRAALAAALVVVLVEGVLSRNREWFADRASWQWESKQRLIDAGSLDAPVAVFGTSVMFHGLDPTIDFAGSRNHEKVVNLALNGHSLQHSTQLLERYLRKSSGNDTVFLELREATLDRASWLRGPYFRFWATWDEFLQSKSYYWEPSLLIPFAANRLLTSFRYREGIDNWLTVSARTRSLSRSVFERNRAIAHRMRDKKGYVDADYETIALTPEQVPSPQFRPWLADHAGDLWLRRFLTACAERDLRVVLLIPPAPAFVAADRARSGFYADFSSYVARLEKSFPERHLDTCVFEDYPLMEFTDDHHLNRAGKARFSKDFLTWVDLHRSRR